MADIEAVRIDPSKTSAFNHHHRFFAPHIGSIGLRAYQELMAIVGLVHSAQVRQHRKQWLAISVPRPVIARWLIPAGATVNVGFAGPKSASGTPAFDEHSSALTHALEMDYRAGHSYPDLPQFQRTAWAGDHPGGGVQFELRGHVRALLIGYAHGYHRIGQSLTSVPSTQRR